MEKRRRAGPSRQLSLQGCAAGRRPPLLRRQRSEEAAGAAVGADLSVKASAIAPPAVRVAWAGAPPLPQLQLHDSMLFSRQQLAERLRRAWREREARRPNLDIFLAHQSQQQAQSPSPSPSPAPQPRSPMLVARSASFVARQPRAESPATAARNDSPSPQAREGGAKAVCGPQFSPSVAAEKGSGFFRAQRKGNLTPECHSPLGGTSPLVQARNSRNARLSELQLALVEKEVGGGRRTPECHSPLGTDSPCLQFRRLPAKVVDLPSSGRNSPRTPDSQSPFSCSPLVPRTPRTVQKIASDLESCSSGRSSPQSLPRKRPTELPLVTDARSSPLFSPTTGSLFADTFEFRPSSACSSPATPRNCPLPDRPTDPLEDRPLTDRYSPANELPTRPASVNLSVDLTSFDMRHPSDFSNRSSLDSDTDTKATVECGAQLSAQPSQDLPADSPTSASRDEEAGTVQKGDVVATTTVPEEVKGVKDEKNDPPDPSADNTGSERVPCITAVLPDKFLAEVSARLTSVAEKQVLDARQKEIAARSLGLCGRPATAAARRASFRSTGHQPRVADADAEAPPCTPAPTPQPPRTPQPPPQPPRTPQPPPQPPARPRPQPQQQQAKPQKPPPQPVAAAAPQQQQQRQPTKQPLSRSQSAPANRQQPPPQPRPPPAQPSATAPAAQPPPLQPQPRGILVRRPPHHGSSVDVSSKTWDESTQGTARVRFERSVKSAPARRRLRTAKLRLSRPRGDGDSSDEVADGGDERRGQSAAESAAAEATTAAAEARKAEAAKPAGRRAARGSVDVVTMVSLLSPEHSDAEDSDAPATAAAAAAFLAASPRGWMELATAASAATAATPTPTTADSAPAQSASQSDGTSSSSSSSISALMQPTRGGCLRKSPKAVSFQARRGSVVAGLAAAVLAAASPAAPAASAAAAPVASAVAPTAAPSSEKRSPPTPVPAATSDAKRRLVRAHSTPQDTTATESAARGDSGAAAASEAACEPGEGAAPPPQQQQSHLPAQAEAPAAPAFDPTAAPEPGSDGGEPKFHTDKERECWRLYRKMCEKGISVSYDTVLRGMLTPTEYRLRRRALLSSC